MGIDTSIAWTDHTFNPWIGCTKVSPGCKNCYADALDHRWGHDRWGPGKLRQVTSASNWRTPIGWNNTARASGKRARVFCASMADVFDSEAPEGAREWLWALIRATPMLDWQILTKRTGRIAECLPADWGTGYPNVWLGTSTENQPEAYDRWGKLAKVPAAVRFLSCEPLLGPVELRCAGCGGTTGDHLAPDQGGCSALFPDWIIVGGESGHGARPMQMEWARDLVRQCEGTRIKVFVKQLGATAYAGGGHLNAFVPGTNGMKWEPAGPPSRPFDLMRLRLDDSKGGDMAEWPTHLRVRQFPGEAT